MLATSLQIFVVVNVVKVVEQLPGQIRFSPMDGYEHINRLLTLVSTASWHIYSSSYYAGVYRKFLQMS